MTLKDASTIEPCGSVSLSQQVQSHNNGHIVVGEL